MRGKVLAFDAKSGQGMISGNDGRRYPAAREQIHGGATSLIPGREVDFEVDSAGQATSIYPVPGGGVGGDRNKLVAALLAFFLGGLGIHKFYLGKKTAGIIHLLCFFPGMLLVVPAVASTLIAFVEAIIYLVKDEQKFHEEYVIGQKSWF